MKKSSYFIASALVLNVICSLPSTCSLAHADGQVVGQAASLESEVDSPCTLKEQWAWSGEDAGPGRKKWNEEFQMALSGKRSSVRSFSEALYLRQSAKDDVDRSFAEYWMSRALMHAGFIHLAEKGFNAILTRPVNSSLFPYQMASVGCISMLHKKYPALAFDHQFIQQLQALSAKIPSNPSSAQRAKASLSEAAFLLLMDEENNKSSEQGPPPALAFLKGSGPYESLGAAVDAAGKNRHSEAVKYLADFFANPKVRDSFKRYLDQAHLLYGRSLYALGRYPEAIQQYKSIGNHSNEWVFALNELAWAYLMSGKYREAIGTGIGLQSGALRHVFSPEALMVMAMSLNEMCRFPESMNLIQSFRKKYRGSFHWLAVNATKGTSLGAGDFYHQAIAFAKNSPTSKVPAVIGSEWIRSPLFIADQDRINLLFAEKTRADQLSLQGKNEQKAMAISLLTEVKNLRKKFKAAKMKLKPGESVPASLIAEADNFREKLSHFRRVRNAGPFWRTLLARYQSRVPQIQTQMVNSINQEIARLNGRMLSQLNEIAENNELIEVEIYNGASEDIIWQNAHPDYKEMIKKYKAGGTETAAEDKVWDWGKTEGGLDGRGEIWEDEFDSMTANLYDNCENKDKYIAVERAVAGV